MINISGSYSIGGKSHRNLAAQVEENTKDIKYLLDNGVLPEGTKNIEENGEYEVKRYANVNVQVPIGIFPTGTKLITTNGNFNIEEFANVFVNVTQDEPSFNGTTTISIDIYNNTGEQKTFRGIKYLSYIPNTGKIGYVKSPDITVDPGNNTHNYEIGTANQVSGNVFFVNTNYRNIGEIYNANSGFSGLEDETGLIIEDPSQTVYVSVILN